MKMICISSMGESAQSYVESTTVLSDYEDDYYERPDSFYLFKSTNISEVVIATRNKSNNGMGRMI